MYLPINIKRAIKCGGIPRIRNWRKLPLEKLTRGERVLKFIEAYCKTPEGSHVGEPLVLAKFQEAFILAIYDNPHQVRRAQLSIARKNGKSAVIACIALAHIAGPEAVQNSQIITAALSREQAALIFKLAQKMVMQSPELSRAVRVVPSQKTLIGLNKNVEFKSIARDSSGASTQGLSPVLCIFDEIGQVKGQQDEYLNALTSSQGAHEHPLFICISTQSASDSDWFAASIDDSIRSKDRHTVTHVYESEKGCSLMDKRQWAKANPALGIFRNIDDLKQQLEKADRLPVNQASALNLLLNQRVSIEQLWLAPKPWQEADKPIDLEVFKSHKVACGIDLSAKIDLTCCCLAAKDDDGDVHLLPFTFTPLDTIEERQKRDRAPYVHWTHDANALNVPYLIAVPGVSLDYKMIAQHMATYLEKLGIHVDTVGFDRWRIDIMREAAEQKGFATDADWVEIGQGYQSMSPILESFETLLLKGDIRHAGNPLLTLGASHGIAMTDPAGNKKLAKGRDNNGRIDSLVAAIMASFMVTDGGGEDEADCSWWIA